MLDNQEKTFSEHRKERSQRLQHLKNPNSISEIIEISDGDTILARYIPSKTIQKPGLNFYSNDSEFIQFGVWGYDAGKVLPAHVHNQIKRTSNSTQEALFVQRGKIKAMIFDLSGSKIKEIEVSQGEVLILLHGAHGYEIIEDHTQVLEFKNGPYVGAERDRKRIES